MRRVVIGPAGSEPSELHEYFRAVEEQFIGLRGAPFLLTPKDWKVISSWYERGVPLALVASALRSVFEARRERGDTARVSSIRYCAPAVEAAWKEAQELLLSSAVADEGVRVRSAADGSVGTSWRERLEQVAERIPEHLCEISRWRQRVVALGRSPSEEAARQGLREIEDGLLREVDDALSGAERAALEKRLAEALEEVRSRVAPAELPTVRATLRRRFLRESVGLAPLRLA